MLGFSWHMSCKRRVWNICLWRHRKFAAASPKTPQLRSPQHGLCYTKLAKRLGDGAGLYLRANQEALEEFRISPAGFPVIFRKKDAFVYTLSSRKKYGRRQKTSENWAFPPKLSRNCPSPCPFKAPCVFPNRRSFIPSTSPPGSLLATYLYPYKGIGIFE